MHAAVTTNDVKDKNNAYANDVESYFKINVIT